MWKLLPGCSCHPQGRLRYQDTGQVSPHHMSAACPGASSPFFLWEVEQSKGSRSTEPEAALLEKGRGVFPFSIKVLFSGTSLVVYWLGLCAPKAGALGSITGQGTRSHRPQLRPGTDKQMNKYTKYFLKRNAILNCCHKK